MMELAKTFIENGGVESVLSAIAVYGGIRLDIRKIHERISKMERKVFGETQH